MQIHGNVKKGIMTGCAAKRANHRLAEYAEGQKRIYLFVKKTVRRELCTPLLLWLEEMFRVLSRFTFFS